MAFSGRAKRENVDWEALRTSIDLSNIKGRWVPWEKAHMELSLTAPEGKENAQILLGI